MAYRLLLVLIIGTLLTGCWNGGNTHVNLGDVSLGTQLLDLKTALDSGAITMEEYADTKDTLLALNSLCENTEDESSSWF